MAKSSTKITKENVTKFIDEATFDTDKRASGTLEYEQMLMAYIENEFRGDNK